jgi:hypothetical protein
MGGWFIILGGLESMEWYQPFGNHIVDVFDPIPLTPFQPLLRVVLPSAAFTG